MLGDYITAAIDKLQRTSSTGIAPFSRINPAMQPHPSRQHTESISESVEGLLPGTDEGRPKVSRVTRSNSTETRPSSRNSVADTCAYASLAHAYQVLDRRQDILSGAPNIHAHAQQTTKHKDTTYHRQQQVNTSVHTTQTSHTAHTYTSYMRTARTTYRQ